MRPNCLLLSSCLSCPQWPKALTIISDQDSFISNDVFVFAGNRTNDAVTSFVIILFSSLDKSAREETNLLLSIESVE